MRAAWRRLRQRLCRHRNSAIELHIDGPAPGWRWTCHTCRKTTGGLG